jgi:EAL domain-containing protein (putative c-di-GMP-specific phosphodiesterase class I)
MAEKKGMMPLLDRYVIRTVCSQIRQWLDMNLEVLPISINLSARHLFEQDTIAVIFEHVGEFDIPPHMLEVEVTEYGLIKDYKKTAINMMRLEKAGISVAIDDYGTGHANLETVLSLPIKHLKIDQSFIRLGMKSVKGQAILENIISLAKSLKVVTTAEGVETQEQLDYLKNAQCDAIQGYLLSKPMKLKDFEDLMNRKNEQ